MTDLTKEVWSEAALAELLNTPVKRITYLRNAKALPFVRLTNTLRVYLARDVLKWLEDRAELTMEDRVD